MHTQFIPCINPSWQPTLNGIECLAHRRGDSSDSVYYDFFPSRDEVAAVLGDVDSVGIEGTILTTGLQSSLRCMVRQGVDLKDAVSEINRILWELAPDSVHGTLFSARVNPSARSLRYINAGHHTAFVVRSDRTVQYLEPNAAPLALSRSSSYKELRIRFDPGDVLITASDDIELDDIGSIVASRRIGESAFLAAARIVIVVSYRNPEEGPASRMARIPAVPLLRAAA